ncbi:MULTISPECIES: hypothetical protein [unclassified Rathayibacter]|uniref:hypothetical protein n=1 Tax=unclassified Rathayibacter TaxID=2609250 RepID=UPI0011B02F93|nr:MULTISPECIES: hypothetical protein [unclassified Rathayibacter]
MTSIEPSVALNTCETALRSLIVSCYSREYGASWLERVASTATRGDWEARADTELRARGSKGVGAVPPAGLDYANFYDLVGIASADWAPLAAALGARKNVLPLLKRVNDLRNSISHNRPLLPFEKDLLSGISGQIRNQVTLYLSSQDPAGEIYPRIESIADSFGRGFESTTGRGEIAGAVTTPLILVQPGDQVVFTCFGLDPQERELEWSITGANHLQRESQVGASGQAVELTWAVADDEVRESGLVEIKMQSVGARYFRCGYFDQRAYFQFIIRPPDTF